MTTAFTSCPLDHRLTESPELCPSCGVANAHLAAECVACGRALLSLRPESSSNGSNNSNGAHRIGTECEPGQIFAGRYLVIDRLGRGGMGVVYKVRDVVLDRIVAIKMVRSGRNQSPETLERFRREWVLARRLAHENVCRVHGLGVHAGVHYLIMEYLDDTTLAELLARIGGLSVRQTLAIAAQVASALDAIHALGIVHRDLKPSNIAVQRHRVVVMDFGLARGALDPQVTLPGQLVGCYAYLSPEHVRSDRPSAAVDIYALGLILFEMLTRRRPPGDTDQRPLASRGARAVCPRPSELEPDVPAALDELTLRCLSWSPGDRPTARELIERFDRMLSGTAAPSRRARAHAGRPFDRARRMLFYESPIEGASRPPR